LITKGLLVKIFYFLAVFLIYLSFARYTESIPVSSGLGWDGVLYANIALDPIKELESGKIEKQKIQRILPSIVAYVIVKGIGRDLNHQNVIIGFQILNALCMTLSYLYFLKICNFLKFSKKQIIIGFILCFINFQFIKFYSYYPVLTDYFAFFLSIISTYFWINNNKSGLVIIAFLAAFTWPALFLQILIQISFNFENNKIANFDIKNITNKTKILQFSVFLGITLSIYSVYLIKTKTFPYFDKPEIIYLTIGFINVFLTTVFISYSIIHSLLDAKLLNRVSIFLSKWIFISLFLYVTINTFIGTLPTVNSNVTFKYAFNLFLIRSYEFPLINIISHSIILSPIVVYFMFKYKLSIYSMKWGGIGMVFMFLLNFTFLFNSETRHLLHFYPILVLAFIRITEVKISYLLLVHIFLSSFYINFNTNSFNSDLFFLFLGPFISRDYYIYLFTSSMVALILFSLCSSKFKMSS